MSVGREMSSRTFKVYLTSTLDPGVLIVFLIASGFLETSRVTCSFRVG